MKTANIFDGLYWYISPKRILFESVERFLELQPRRWRGKRKEEEMSYESVGNAKKAVSCVVWHGTIREL